MLSTERELKEVYKRLARSQSQTIYGHSGWIKFTENLPPTDGTDILIAMRNKNMDEDGIWLYDVCNFFGGDYTDNDNWNCKINWETPIYWSYINEPK